MSRYGSRHSVVVDPEVTVNMPQQPDPDHDELEIDPGDSASQIKSVTSSIASSRANLLAKAAALKVEAEAMKQRHHLEAQEADLRKRKEELELQTQLAIINAQTNVFDDVDKQQQSRSVLDRPQEPCSNLDRHHELLAAVHLPHAEIMYFDGNPLDYYSFTRSFENSIERACTSDVSKLTRLLQYCKGRAKHVIQCCAVMDPTVGFQKAKNLLKERFGNNYVIAEAWVDKVSKGKVIGPHDKEALREFADDLVNCEVTLTAMNCLHEVNTQRVLVEIVSKLPTYLQNRWIRMVREIRTKQCREASMKDLVSFVTAAAEEATDPVYSKLMSGRERPHSGQNGTAQKSGKRQSFSGLTNNENMPNNSMGITGQSRIPHACVVCGNSHSIFQCERFRGFKPEERRKLARSKGLCFNCLKGGHRADSCELQRTCSVPGCGQKHTRYLHLTPAPEVIASTSTPDGNGPAHTVSANQGTGQAFSGAGIARVALPLVPVRAWAPGGGRYIDTYALLDGGSTTTFCTKRLAEQLHEHGKPEVLTLNTLGQTAQRMESSVLSLDVTDVNEQNTIRLSTVYTTAELPISPQCGVGSDEVKSWSHLCDIEICNASIESVDLLIGQDNPDALIPREVRMSNSSNGKAPFAVRTLLGWTVQGPVEGRKKQSAVVGFTKSDVALQQSLQRFWELDSDDRVANDTRGMSVNDKRVIELWQNKLQMSDGHYELPIPFDKNQPPLCDNRIVAERRLMLLRRKLSMDPEKCNSYKQGIAEMVSKGYAEKVPEDEKNAEQVDSVVWYLPHHSVTSVQKPDKIRIVFDCAAKFNGISLNDVVLQGPDLTNRLTAVLMRFRIEPIALMADIESMFYQVRVTPCDRNVLRFLWWKDGDLDSEVEEYRMMSHPFGGVWSPSCANFALRHTAEDNRNEFDDEVTACVYRNFYVDDCLKSVDSVERAVMFVQKLTELLSRGGFRLTKWISNCRQILELISDEDRAKGVKNLDISRDKLPTERALGAVWDVEADTLGFRSVINRRPLTRRGILSILSSVYDPLGFLGPYVLCAKKIVQELCRRQIGWDDPVPTDILPQWSEWLSGLNQVESVKIPRCIKPPDLEYVRYELHHFCDASMTAYGTASYLTVFKADEFVPVSCNLLTAKSRLAPIKVQTVPRLELMAATLAVRMDSMIQQELDIHVDRTAFWTDSTIVLQYIRNERTRFHVFVANRLAVIHDASTPEQWRYVPSKDNVADDASRGLGMNELISSRRWWRGPDFLWLPEDKWPEQPLLCSIADNDPEVKNSGLVEDSYVTVQNIQSDCITDRLLLRRSDWPKLKKDVAWILRFIAYLRHKSKQVSHMSTNGQLSVRELQTAEQAIVRYIQRTHFPHEFSILQACGSSADCAKFVRRGSVLCRLNPFMNSSGIMCVGGRLRHAPSLSSEAKYPVILPRSHHVVELLIRYVHNSSGHVGREHVLSLLQENYWIIRGRVAVRTVLSKCVICRRLAARCGEQIMADLPVERVTAEKPPFTYVGVDVFGPFIVRRGRSEVKRYGCLFTCLVIRAIHIEVIHSMDTDSFLNALQRFICRRGRPTEIISDNGTNFKAGDRELRKAVREWNQSKIATYLQQREIEWRFNPPAASHWGGVWERQIRTVRKILGSVVKEQVLDDESLQTVMCQAEYIVNSRPLTAISDDPCDLEALTPNHLLTLRKTSIMPLGISAKEDCYRRRWRQIQYIADIFWKRWTREYLPSLQNRQKWCTVTRDFKPGDVVLLMEDTSRCNWSLARITVVHPGSDGRVRSVTLKTRGTSVLERPISKICLLEGRSVPDVSSGSAGQ